MTSKKTVSIMVVSLLCLCMLTVIKFGSVSACYDKQNPPSAGTVYISNGILKVSLQDTAGSTGIGTFTIRTDNGHPNPSQNVFYGGAVESPWSTFTTVRVEDTLREYVTSTSGKTASAGYEVRCLDNYSPVVEKVSDTRATVTWTTGENLLITQLIDIRGSTVADTMVQVTVNVKNLDSVSHFVAVRYEWDLMIDGNDDSWIRPWMNPSTPQGWTETETDWVAPSFQFWETVNDPNSPVFSIYGSTIVPNVNPPPTVPDRLVYASWSASYATAYSYTPSGNSGMDSATLYYWYAVEASPNVEITRTAYVTSVVQQQLQSFAWATDAVGSQKSEFSLADNVYVKGEQFPADTPVTIYLIPDGTTAMPSNAIANADAMTDGSGNLAATLVWSSPLDAGSYDIWVDVNQNGVFDAGDVWNNQAVGIYGLLVIPEFWLGSVLGLAGCFAAFGVFRISKHKPF